MEFITSMSRYDLVPLADSASVLVECHRRRMNVGSETCDESSQRCNHDLIVKHAPKQSSVDRTKQ